MQSVSWNWLPSDIYHSLFSCLEHAELMVARRVCKLWKRLIEDRAFWAYRTRRLSYLEQEHFDSLSTYRLKQLCMQADVFHYWLNGAVEGQSRECRLVSSSGQQTLSHIFSLTHSQAHLFAGGAFGLILCCPVAEVKKATFRALARDSAFEENIVSSLLWSEPASKLFVGTTMLLEWSEHKMENYNASRLSPGLLYTSLQLMESTILCGTNRNHHALHYVPMDDDFDLVGYDTRTKRSVLRLSSPEPVASMSLQASEWVVGSGRAIHLLDVRKLTQALHQSAVWTKALVREVAQVKWVGSQLLIGTSTLGESDLETVSPRDGASFSESFFNDQYLGVGSILPLDAVSAFVGYNNGTVLLYNTQLAQAWEAVDAYKEGSMLFNYSPFQQQVKALDLPQPDCLVVAGLYNSMRLVSRTENEYKKT